MLQPDGVLRPRLPTSSIGHSYNTDAPSQNPVNTKILYNICTMLDQRRRRWADVVQMLYKCFVSAGKAVPAHLRIKLFMSFGFAQLIIIKKLYE